MSESYVAWDNNEYPWPPPDGWYQSPDKLWWPEGYGPGPAPVVESPPMRPSPAAETYSPPVSAVPLATEPAPGAPNLTPGMSPSVGPATVAPPGTATGFAPPPGAVAPGTTAGYVAGTGPGAESEAPKGGSGRKVFLILLGLIVAMGLVAVPVVLALRSSSDAGEVTSTTTTPTDQSTVTAVPREESPPPAGSGPGSLDQPWAVNDPIGIFYPDFSNDGEEARWTVQVTGGAFDGTDAVLTENQFNDPPSDGFVFVLVPIRLTYKSGPAPVSVSDLQFKALGPSARVLTEFGDSCGVIPDDLDDLTELFPGGVVEGNLCWAAPVTDLGDLKLIVEVVSAEGAVYIDINE